MLKFYAKYQLYNINYQIANSLLFGLAVNQRLREGLANVQASAAQDSPVFLHYQTSLARFLSVFPFARPSALEFNLA
jgi:hypothetical protein